ncbi:hypothetical protein [Streptomyces sp. NPDC048638]|uniref:hypothetical protein n=1 Tax=Streptomyces sp. NPDC048638 TaxID=3365580 RepID=UPI0037102DF3
MPEVNRVDTHFSSSQDAYWLQAWARPSAFCVMITACEPWPSSRKGGSRLVYASRPSPKFVELGAQGVLDAVAAARLGSVGGGAVLVRAAAGGDRGIARVRIGERQCPVGAVDAAAGVVGVLAADVVDPSALARVRGLLE